MQLILVRHPKPQVGAGICYGSTDLPPDPADLLRVRDALASLAPATPLISSPLLRCAQLARQLPSASLSFDARLAEMHFGDWEMQAWDAIPRAEIEAWAADPANYRPGGGESVLQMATRVAAFHAALQRQQHERVMVLCHAGTIRLLLACHAGLAPPEAAREAAGTPHRIGYGEHILLES